jgi:tetratricopeptide (TPR) repeat protein
MAQTEQQIEEHVRYLIKKIEEIEERENDQTGKIVESKEVEDLILDFGKLLENNGCKPDDVHDEAILHFKSVVGPPNPAWEWWESVLRAYLGRNNPNDARKEIKKEIVNCKDYTAWINRAISFCILGRHKESISSFENAISINPTPYAWERKGCAFYSMAIKSKDDARLGMYEDMVLCCKEAIKINPNYREAWYVMGKGYSNLGDQEEAERCFMRALALRKRSDVSFCKDDNGRKIKIPISKEKWLEYFLTKLERIQSCGVLEYETPPSEYRDDDELKDAEMSRDILDIIKKAAITKKKMIELNADQLSWLEDNLNDRVYGCYTSMNLLLLRDSFNKVNGLSEDDDEGFDLAEIGVNRFLQVINRHLMKGKESK